MHHSNLAASTQDIPLVAMTAAKRISILCTLLLAACASAPQQAAPASKAQVAAATKHSPALPNVELTSDLLFKFLLGEVALQRGDSDLAVQTYLDLARTTRDPRVARRAAQLAYGAHELDKATEAFKLWSELDPDSQTAKQMLASLLVSEGKLEEARPLLAEVLASETDNPGAAFLHMYSLLERQTDKSAVLKLMRELAQPYPRLAEAHWTVAKAAEEAGEPDEALKEVRKARALSSKWEAAAVLEAQLLQPRRPEQALKLLKGFLKANPDASDTRLFYARLLLEQHQYKKSRAQFQTLLKAHPENTELAFAVALLSLQMGELDQAEKELKQALARGKQDQDTVYYYLGQLSEAKKEPQIALQYYRKVRGGKYVFAARLREVYLLNKSGKLDEAIGLLHRMPVQDAEQRVQVLLIEAQLLRDAKRYEQAFEVLHHGLDENPDQPEMLYEAALIADKLGKPDVLERLANRLIELQPNNANAYNVLGYSLLDRNVRVKEGMRLVEKAYHLSPNDAAIIDSVGWGNYRLGNLDKSLEFLRRAFAADPDPEIAAHLGEVLWVKGEKEEAKKIWSDSLKQHPKNESLRAVMKKFLP
jgi:tetratricopeptide (TPR) repeat protein